MARNLKSSMREQIGQDVSDKTFKQYKDIVDRFSVWQKATHPEIRRLSHLPTQDSRRVLIQEFTDHLVEKDKSPDTIHTYVAAVCKGLDVPMRSISKPKRGEVTKGRQDDRNRQGRSELEKLRTRSPDLIRFAEVVGVRKAELYHLTVDDFKTDVTGRKCMHVVKGKGGRPQHQLIKPEDVEFISKFLEGRKGVILSYEDRVALRHVDVHGIRRQHAREMYEVYKTQDHDKLKADLLKTFDSYYNHSGRKSPEAVAKARQIFLKEMEMPGDYICRGQARERALADGRPLRYDRVALMAVSVWHLAHWRNNVTVRNYMV